MADFVFAGLDWTRCDCIWWSAIAKKPATSLTQGELSQLIANLITQGKAAAHDCGDGPLDHRETIPEQQRDVVLPLVPNVGRGSLGIGVLGFGGGGVEVERD